MNIKHKRPFFFLFRVFLVVILVLSHTGCSTGDLPPLASRGILDLRTGGFGSTGITRLRGEWAFAWKQLVPPDQPLPVGRPLHWASVPDPWNELESGGEKLPGTGFGTYRLTILLPSAGEEYALKIPHLPTASRIWVDEVLLSENGTVGTSHEQSRPRYLPQTIVFRAERDRVILNVQVSNFHHRRGGIRQDILFGTAAQLERETLLRLWFEQLLFAGIAFTALFHLSLIPFGFLPSGRKRYASLCFGLFLAGISVRMLFTGEMMMVRLIPDFDWETMLRIEYLATYLPVPLLVGMVGSIFPAQLSYRYRLAVTLPAALIAASVLALPCIIYSRLNVLFQVYTIGGYLLGIVIAARAVIAKKAQARPVLYSLLMILLVCLNQVLFSDDLIRNGDLSPVAVLAELPLLKPFLWILRIPYGLLSYLLSASALLLLSLSLLARNPEPASSADAVSPADAGGVGAPRGEGGKNDVGIGQSKPAATLEDFCRVFEISRRERDILSLSSKGLSNREIAERLYISLPTVKTHMRNLFVKVGAANRAQLGHRLREYERMSSIPDLVPEEE